MCEEKWWKVVFERRLRVEKKRVGVWKDNLERIMNEDDDWDLNVDGDSVGQCCPTFFYHRPIAQYAFIQLTTRFSWQSLANENCRTE